MTDIDKIKAEIEWRLERCELVEKDAHNFNADNLKLICSQIKLAYQSLLDFINSLPKEPVSKDLEEAAQQWYDSTKFKSDLSGTPIGAFKAGASWKKEEMMKDTVDAFIYKGNIRLKEWPLPEKYGKHLDSVKLIIIKKNKDE